MRLNPVLAHSFLSVSKEGSFVWIAVEGGVICCLSVRRGFDAHTKLQNKDLLVKIRYSSIPESSNQIIWIPS